MEQFSLEKHLENPSRKVVTREGRPVRIVCWDLKSNTPIIAAIQWNQEREDCYCYNTIGRCANNVGELDLFFADEEKELTEFDYAVLSIISDHNNHKDSITEFAKRSSKKLLDLARKELQPEIDKEIDKAYKNIDTIVYDNGYKQGQYEILKDLPKWKKAKKDEELDCHVAIQQDDRVVLSDFVQKDEYYITLDVLKKLPKEE